ncbi:hypothetical protein BV898_14968 [Hypsibius exemplaris]|uniref:Nuclear receptor domain-containing protein n=1 Tax=Hypsibius exemplaris TaxID=2072580 RepID=A0A9X6NJB6_HYPEX|nr:hypothetical protein BV898_14968 [Hypsibius exemplaris]
MTEEAFCRRIEEKGTVYVCSFSNDCVIKQKGCRACRYKKCLELGMNMKNMRNKGLWKSNKTSIATQTNIAIAVPIQNHLQSTRSDAQSSEKIETDNLSGFLIQQAEIFEAGLQIKWRTVQSVMEAADKCFGNLILQCKATLDGTLRYGNGPCQPLSSHGSLVDAFSYRNVECAERIRTFASMLPGASKLDDSSKESVVLGWKRSVFWMVRKAPNMLHGSPAFAYEDCYINCGIRDLRCSQYWQESLSDAHINTFIYKFCEEFEDIGLTEMESLLLLAVVMFEPIAGGEVSNPKGHQLSRLIHQHYGDILFGLLKQRCSDKTELVTICQKLERFFCALQDVYKLHEYYADIFYPRQ